MKYTPEEVAKLLANRPNQPHYIEAMIRRCIDEAIRPSAEVVLAKGWYHFRKGEDGAADDYDLYDSTASPCADCIPVKIVRADTTPSPEGQAEQEEYMDEIMCDVPGLAAAIWEEREREAFEAWFSDEWQHPEAVQRDAVGYKLAAAQSAWTAWQAGWRAALAAQQQEGRE